MGTSTRPRQTLAWAAHSPVFHSPLLLAPLRAPERAEYQPPPPGEDRRSSEGWAGRAVELPRTHLPYRGSLQRNTRLQVLLCP